MKRGMLWLVGAGVGGLALMWALHAQERRPSQSVAGTPPGKTIFTFSDDAQVRAFAQLWNQRQEILGRVAVLQRYWNQEQAELAKLNQQLLTQYHVDLNKLYTLDTNRKVLLEREPTPERSGLSEPAHPSPQPAAQEKVE